jgi:hypothetical protein
VETTMNYETSNTGPLADATVAPALPSVVDRATWDAQLDELRVREKARRQDDLETAAHRDEPA